MDLDDAERAKLDDLRFMLGEPAGGLALALEQLTDGMAVIGQHTVYCRVEKGPRAGQAPLDIGEVLRLVGNAKELVQAAVAALREDRR
jgi:hypothetical protein